METNFHESLLSFYKWMNLKTDRQVDIKEEQPSPIKPKHTF